jgi:molybdenum cofactor synthesis domain-containing protein
MSPSTNDRKLRTRVIVVTHRVRSGDYDDRTGPVAANWLRKQNFDVGEGVVIDALPETIISTIQKTLWESDFLGVCGGTGIGPNDVTPQTLKSICEYEIPGFGEMLRRDGTFFSSKAPLGRGGAYVVKLTLVLSTSGSPNAALEQLTLWGDLIDAAVSALKGVCSSRK